MLHVKISPDGAERYEVEVLYRDVYLWEKTGKDRSFPKVAGGLPAVVVYELALIAAKRLGKVDSAVRTDEWAQVTDCEPIQPNGDVDDEGELDPTQPAP